MKTTTLLQITFGIGALLGLSACTKPSQEPTATTSGGSTSTAPSGAEAKKADVALVRFLNATPTSRDLYFGDLKLFPSVSAQSISPYVELPAERHEFKLFASGNTSGDPLATNSEGLTAGKHYTIVGEMKTDGKATLNPIEDDLTRPTPGKVKVRVIHAASGVPKVDVYPLAGKDALISGVSFNDVTGYKEVDPMMTELDIRPFGSKKDEATIQNVNLMADKLYTIIVMGGNGRPLKTQVIEDQLTEQAASLLPSR